MDAVTRVPAPVNEPVRQYQPGSADRAMVEARIKELAGQRADLTMTIGGHQVMGGGERLPVVAPHAFRRVLGDLGNATDEDVASAVEAARRAAPCWWAPSLHHPADVVLSAAYPPARPLRGLPNT